MRVLPVSTGERNPAVVYIEGLGSKESGQTMKYCLNRIAAVFGRKDLEDVQWGAIRREDIQDLIKYLRERQLAPSTINLYLYSIKGVAKEAWLKGQMPQSAYLKINSMKSIRHERLLTGRALSKAQGQKLLAVCDDGTLRGIRDKAILAVMMGCGLRRAEITRLETRHWNGRGFKFVGKGNKQRKVYLPDILVPIVKAWLEVRGDTNGYIFTAIKGVSRVFIGTNRMTVSSVYRIVKRRSQQANVAPISPHDLRRTFATRMLDSGADLFVLKQAMGHSNLSVTERYDRRGDKAAAKAARNIEF